MYVRTYERCSTRTTNDYAHVRTDARGLLGLVALGGGTLNALGDFLLGGQAALRRRRGRRPRHAGSGVGGVRNAHAMTSQR